MEDRMDRFLSLDQRWGTHAGRPVQRVCRANRWLLEFLRSPACAPRALHARSHVGHHRFAKLAGPGLHTGGRTGRICRVPGPVSPQRPRWRGVHLLRSRLCSSFAKAVTSGTAGSEAGLWACLDRLQTDHAEFSALETLRAPNKTSCQRLNNGLPGGGPWL